MPALKHGRPGKARRPRLDESPLRDVAQDEGAHKAMRLLAAEAARRGLSLRELAMLVHRAPESLVRSLYARTPRLETVDLICNAMRLGRVTARALLGMLDERDAYNLRHAALRAVLDRGAIFVSAPAVQDALVSALDAAPLVERYSALAAFAIAAAGLGETSELFSLADALGLDLAAYIADEARLQERKDEMLAARDWALELLKASPSSGEDRAAITAVFARFVEPSDFAPRHALDAAVAEYRRHLTEPAPPATLAGILAGLPPPMKGPKV
jgi:hypothetical protein